MKESFEQATGKKATAFDRLRMGSGNPNLWMRNTSPSSCFSSPPPAIFFSLVSAYSSSSPLVSSVLLFLLCYFTFSYSSSSHIPSRSLLFSLFFVLLFSSLFHRHHPPLPLPLATRSHLTRANRHSLAKSGSRDQIRTVCLLQKRMQNLGKGHSPSNISLYRLNIPLMATY